MIPPVSDSKWIDLVLGKDEYHFYLLGLKILMSRVLKSTTNDATTANVNRCVNEVYEFFTKNEKIVQKDLQQIFKQDVK